MRKKKESKPTGLKLFKRWQETGNKSLAEQIFHENHPMVYGRINAKLHNHERSVELSSDVFQKIFSHTEPVTENFEGYLSTMAINKVLEELRRRQPPIMIDVAKIANDLNLATFNDAEQTFNDEMIEVIIAKADLSEKEQACYFWKLDGYQVQEIAAMLDISATRVSQIRSGALAKLRVAFKQTLK